jgi:hypothetical protein
MAPTPSPTEEDFTGFANAAQDKDGKLKDFRDVKPRKPKSEADKIRHRSQTTESSIVAFKTEGTGTNGPPAAVVAPKAKESDQDADAAEGKEGGQA